MTTIAEPTCPKCDGPMWNNIETKRNPKQPDFKCKDKQCEGVIWPPRGQGNGAAAPARAAAPAQQKQGFEYQRIPIIDGPEPQETGAPPMTATIANMDKLFALYGVCLSEAIQQAQKLDASNIGSSPETVTSMAATLFIAATRGGAVR